MAPKKQRPRRNRGSGSIYQTKDGSWIAQERIDGKLVRRRSAEESGAKKRLAELQELKAKRIDLRSGAQTVTAWAHACLSEKVRLRKPKPRTVEFERDMMERYIVPVIGDMPIIDVRPTHLQGVIDQIYADIQAAGVYDGARTAHGVAGVLEEIFTLAFSRKLIPDMPYTGIILPIYKRKPIEPLSDEQLRLLLAAAAGETDKRPAYRTKDGKTKRLPPIDRRLEPLWWAYVFLGLRRGEGLGLRWMGRADGTIKIDQQVQRLNGKEIAIGLPKTDDSVRVLPLPRRLEARLSAHWHHQQGERASHDDKRLHDPRIEPWQERGLMFPSHVGTPLWPDNLETQFRRLRDAAGLPSTIKLHHLRHTLSTLLDECGATEAIKAAILGHAKQTMTQKYTHGRIAAMRAVMQAVEDRIIGDAVAREETGT